MSEGLRGGLNGGLNGGQRPAARRAAARPAVGFPERHYRYCNAVPARSPITTCRRGLSRRTADAPPPGPAPSDHLAFFAFCLVFLVTAFSQIST
ncbi:hypothetical protein C6P77_27640 [Burkholderia ambifaria]|nr:hypothetical protein C6P77_27640 [Burkholderia ambifaria]